jgi:hypothetical protein
MMKRRAVEEAKLFVVFAEEKVVVVEKGRLVMNAVHAVGRLLRISPLAGKSISIHLESDPSLKFMDVDDDW